MKYFLTFANTDYMSTNRIVNQAKKFEVFDNIISMTENDIPDFIKKHEEFIKMHPSGYGYWIWKPKIILDTLLKLNNDDLLVYCDAGMYLNINGKKRLDQYFNILNNGNKSLITFSANDAYKAQYYVKNDAIMNYYPDFNDELNNCCYAGVMIIKKNVESLNLIHDWLKLCENYHYLDKSPSHDFQETKLFRGNDCDNGLFNLCLTKHKISHNIYPDETNVYMNGIQLHHKNFNIKSMQCDYVWECELYNYPFQCRRMTPKFGY